MPKETYSRWYKKSDKKQRLNLVSCPLPNPVFGLHPDFHCLIYIVCLCRHIQFSEHCSHCFYDIACNISMDNYFFSGDITVIIRSRIFSWKALSFVGPLVLWLEKQGVGIYWNSSQIFGLRTTWLWTVLKSFKWFQEILGVCQKFWERAKEGLDVAKKKLC